MSVMRFISVVPPLLFFIRILSDDTDRLMEMNTKTSSPDAVMCTSSEVSAPDECGRNLTAVASAQLNGRTSTISVKLHIPSSPKSLGMQDSTSNQHYETAFAATNEDRHVNLLTQSYLACLNVTDDSETAVAATSEDRQVNLLTKSYLARLNVMDDSEDDDLEEYERGDDDSTFPSAIQETMDN